MKNINQFIKQNWEKLTTKEIMEKTGLSSQNAVLKRGYCMKLPRKKHALYGKVKSTPEEQVAYEKEILEKKRREITLERKYKILLAENISLQKKIDATKVIKPIETYIIPEYKSNGGNEATAVVLLSDIHYGETVKKDEVMGLNEYNPEIARQRCDEFFKHSKRILDVLGKDIPIRNIVLGLLGDHINNMMFEDAIETNALSPMDEIIAVQKSIASGIEYYLKISDRNLTIVCMRGNHSRITRKPRISGAQGHSLEYLMYHNLATYFQDEPRVKWIIPEAYLCYVKVYDQTLAFHHGEAVVYYGGIGGLTIPMNKAIAQWENSKHADIYVCGHFHQRIDGGNFIVNGSVVGYNAYAISKKCKFEKPQQVLFLIDKKRGRTITAPILFNV